MERAVDPIRSKKTKTNLVADIKNRLEYIKEAKSRYDDYESYNMHMHKDLDTIMFQISSNMSTTRDQLSNTISNYGHTYVYWDYVN